MRIFYTFLLSVIVSLSFGQNQVIIGSFTTTNSNTTYPTPYGNWYWGAKHQFLIRASELSSAGMSAGNINAMAFSVVTANGVPLNSFNIKMGLTNTNDLTGVFLPASGLTTVYSTSSYTETAGWNTHTFSTPFYWDGTSNIIIETCFNNNNFSQNAVVHLTNTSFNSTVYYYADNSLNCAASSGSPVTTRPVIRFDYIPANIPPTANFTSNNTNACSGTVHFYDISTGGQPTSWLWDFGDGTTDTVQNPIHTYTSNGNYTVSLIACNQYGCDTLIIPNYITINLSPSLPVPANCYPATLNGTLGFGITNVTLNTINNSSADASVGFEDFTCISTNLTIGQNYTLSVTHDQPTNHNCAAWIDWNNDGILDDVNERILTSSSSLSSSATFTVPATATLNTPLRMRISADYDFSAPPTPCSNLDYGQAEDYTVIVTSNNNPPDVAFTADVTYTCDGTVSFTDLTQNLPQTWLWDFGDGTTSNVQNPTHTYTSDGTYTVILTCTNANGSDADTIVNYITVNMAGAVTPASCTPQTTAYCCGYGIYQVSFNTISNITADGSEGYQDYSCQHQTTVYSGNSYTLTVKTGINNPQDTRVWIDFDNDGVFSSSELVMDNQSGYNPSAVILIPSSGLTLNTPLRMRVRSDVVSTPKNACDAPLYGQIEDYGIIIDTLPTPPLADFTSDIRFTCNDSIHFYDLSTNNPTSWSWNFGDGGTSTQQNPVYKYNNPGTYNVSLIVSNAGGSNTKIKYNYIVVNCDTAEIPINGNQINTNCNSYIFDDGRSLNYSNNADGSITIQPANASSVMLQFLTFDFATGDTLFIYNAATMNSSTLIGAFTGNSLPANITSSTGVMTVRQKTNGNTTRTGFLAEWTCSNAINEFSSESFSIYPNPTQGTVFIENLQNKKITTLSVYSLLGKHIATISNPGSIINLNDYNLSNGVYFIEINKKYYYKISKQ